MIKLELGEAQSNRNGLRHSTVLMSAACALLSCLACSDDNPDDGVANYYLSGRVVNGSTLEPIPEATVTLSVGDNTRTTHSEPDGSFSVGPIAPESDYRIAAQLEGFDAFAFYGSRLPRLDNEKDRDRALVGDVGFCIKLARTPPNSPSAPLRRTGGCRSMRRAPRCASFPCGWGWIRPSVARRLRPAQTLVRLHRGPLCRTSSCQITPCLT